MPNTTYTYSKAADFPNGSINPTKLQKEIAASAIITALDHISTEGDVVRIVFKDALSATDKTILDGDISSPAGGLIAAHDASISAETMPVAFINENGVPMPAHFDSEGLLRSTSELPDGDKFNLYSVNWCDKCSWYEGSTKVTDGALTDTNDGLTFSSPHDFWIDLRHGRITGEDVITRDGSYLVVVKVNGVTKTEADPGQTNNDFHVDYENGNVIFHSSQAGNTVTATYWYAVTGDFTVAPPAGKKFVLQRVEVQFSRNIILKDTMIFQPFGYVQDFAPQYCPVPYPPNTIIPLGDPYTYKTAADYVNDSNGSYPLIPAFGGNSWRGQPDDMIILTWTYVSKTALCSSKGMSIKLSMLENVAHEGDLATVTFYTTMTDDC